MSNVRKDLDRVERGIGASMHPDTVLAELICIIREQQDEIELLQARHRDCDRRWGYMGRNVAKLQGVHGA